MTAPTPVIALAVQESLWREEARCAALAEKRAIRLAACDEARTSGAGCEGCEEDEPK